MTLKKSTVKLCPPDWQTMPCNRAGNMAGTNYLELSCPRLTFDLLDCASWLLDMEEDRNIKILSTSKGLFPMLTGWEPPFEEALNWLQFVYTVDRARDYVAPASTVLDQSAIAEGEKIFPAVLYHLRRLYPEVYGPAVFLVLAPVCREFPLG